MAETLMNAALNRDIAKGKETGKITPQNNFFEEENVDKYSRRGIERLKENHNKLTRELKEVGQSVNDAHSRISVLDGRVDNLYNVFSEHEKMHFKKEAIQLYNSSWPKSATLDDITKTTYVFKNFKVSDSNKVYEHYPILVVNKDFDFNYDLKGRPTVILFDEGVLKKGDIPSFPLLSHIIVELFMNQDRHPHITKTLKQIYENQHYHITNSVVDGGKVIHYPASRKNYSTALDSNNLLESVMLMHNPEVFEMVTAAMTGKPLCIHFDPYHPIVIGGNNLFVGTPFNRQGIGYLARRFSDTRE